jgi:transposase
MVMLADTVDAVIGVDTHTDTHTACLLDRLGREIATVTVPADPGGYAALIAWAGEHSPGSLLVWAVEGTRSHGVGLVRALRTAGQLVIEAGRPSRVSRRPGGKSDPADARRAARDALAASTPAHPREDGVREALRILLDPAARPLPDDHGPHRRGQHLQGAHTHRAGPAPRATAEQLRSLSTPTQIRRCLPLRAAAGQPIAEQVLRRELSWLARHIRTLDLELRHNESVLHGLVVELMPALLDQPGVGPMSAAQQLVSWSHPGRFRSEGAFASLAGVSPVEASSGRITRHRLNRFGDRQLNRALHVIVNWRMLHDPATHGYLHRRRAEQKTDREIRRCLKRYTARRLYRIMQAAAAPA